MPEDMFSNAAAYLTNLNEMRQPQKSDIFLIIPQLNIGV